MMDKESMSIPGFFRRLTPFRLWMVIGLISTLGSILYLESLYARPTERGDKAKNQATHINDDARYLLKPTGRYGIGYQDVFLINTDLCPDVFYHKNVNESDFSVNNKKHCHEIALRIYYPSNIPIKLNAKYYAPYLIARNKWIEKHHNLSPLEITQLNSLLELKTFTSEKAAPIQKNKFPIIIFVPGSGMPAQAYSNYISELVSHGYIVVGMNSFFINGGIQLNNGHIVMPPDSYLDVHGRNENLSDLKFLLNHLKDATSSLNLDNEMDFNNIALIGHSRGGMSIVNLLQKHLFKNVQAIILLDPANMLKEKNYPIPKLNVPTMTIWSSKFKIDWHGSTLLEENGYEVILKNKHSNNDFSDHNNFSDESTLQYHPGYKIPKLGPKNLGKGDGYTIAKEINAFSLLFLDTFVKQIPNKNFHECENTDSDFILKCGSGHKGP